MADAARVTGFSAPMGVAYDPAGDRYLVANAPAGGLAQGRDGYITAVMPDGAIASRKWLSGLKSPKGMRVREGMLYIADRAAIVVADIGEARIVRRIEMPGAYNLTDLTFDAQGNIFATDAGQDLTSGALFEVPAGGQPRLLVRADRLLRPVGIECMGDRLLMTSMVGAVVQSLDKEGKLIDSQTYPMQRLNPSGVRPGETVSSIVAVDGKTIAAANREAGNVALIDISKPATPPADEELARTAAEKGIEVTALMQERLKNAMAAIAKSRAQAGGSGADAGAALFRRMMPPATPPEAFLANGLEMAGKLALDTRRNRLLVTEIQGNALRIVPLPESPTILSRPTTEFSAF